VIPGARISEDRVIQNVPRLNSRLESALPAQRKDAKHRQIKVPCSRPAELVPTAVPESDTGWLPESVGVEPRARGSDQTGRVEVTNEIRRLSVRGCIQRRAAGRHRERRSTEGSKHPVHLPVVDDRPEHVAIAAATLP
jgi:hypothetical protein